MKNRKLILILSLVLALTMSLGGTLAYLTDTDADVNTMVLGNVDIEQHEYQRATNEEDGAFKTDNIDNQNSYVLEAFEDDKPLLPATELDANGKPYNFGAGNWDDTYVRMSQVDSQGGAQVFESPLAVDKFVTVENTGKTDAYVRTLIAYELGAVAEANWENLIRTSAFMTDKKVWNAVDCGVVEIKGNNYVVVEYVYNGGAHLGGVHANGILPAGATTYPSLCQVYMTAAATNKDVVDLDGNANGKYDILVLSQAIQADGFADATTALTAGFGAANETNIKNWFEGDESTNVLPSTKTVMNLEDLQAALEGASKVDSNTTITLGADIVGDVHYTQDSAYTVLVDGNGYSFTGVFTISGGSQAYDTTELIIKDVNFIAADTTKDEEACIKFGKSGTTSERYVNHVTISNCTFSDPTAAENHAAIRSFTGGDKNVTIENCTVNAGMHSLCQLKNVAGLTISGCKVYSKNGANLNSTPAMTVEDCFFNVKGYALRFGPSSGGDAAAVKNYVVKNSTLGSTLEDPSDAVIIFRSSAANANTTLTLENTVLNGTTLYKGHNDVIIKN